MGFEPRPVLTVKPRLFLWLGYFHGYVMLLADNQEMERRLKQALRKEGDKKKGKKEEIENGGEEHK